MSGNQIILSTLLGIVLLLFMLLKTKIHTFLALILASIFIGGFGGMPLREVLDAMVSGFGSTVGSIGIVLGLGMMMGEVFEVSGAAKRMAYNMIKWLGRNREEEAMAFTGFLVSVPIFCDSGFILLAPMLKEVSRQSKKSVVGLGIALASGLFITHSVVPPTPGPVGVAGIFGADIGSVILWGIVIAIPMAAAAMFYGKHMGKKIYQLPTDDGEEWKRPRQPLMVPLSPVKMDEEGMPGTTNAFLPVVIPSILILLGTAGMMMGAEGNLGEAIAFFGNPIVAMIIALLIAIYTLTRRMSRERVVEILEKGIQSSGSIILIVGAGGALGSVLTTSGIGQNMAVTISQSKLPAILLPFLVSTILRFIQGSGTVAMLTSASITSPAMQTLGVDPVLATLSACVGSLFFSYFNDSFFWVVNRTIHITDTEEQLKVWSVTTTIAWLVGLVCLLFLNALL